MEETAILETFRFDFTYKERDKEKLDKLFVKYGYPNLVVDLSDAYDGYWQVYNKRNGNLVWNDYHSGFVTFFKDNKDLKIAFNHKSVGMNTKPNFNFEDSVYFEKNLCITDYSDNSEVSILKSQVESLVDRVQFLEKEVRTYQERESKIRELINNS